jgi:peptidoglycan/xylan/chitin deacetylase (PgdA/CDA1 family)
MYYIKLIFSVIIIIFFIACRSGENKNDNQGSPPGSKLQASLKSIKKIRVTANGFLYHRFNESKYPSTNISTSLFEDQLKYLVRNEIPVITLGELLIMAEPIGGKTRYVIISIDDAFKSFYHHGFPLLKKYGLKATLFVNTETIGSGDYMNWDELREILEYGIEIGNHTHSHAYFLNDPPEIRVEKFKEDVNLAQRIFKEHLNHTCRVFAYPFGEYDSGMKNIIREMGFDGAAAQNSGVISEFADPYALPRFPMTDQFGQIASFIEKVNMNPLPVIEIIPSSTLPDNNPPTLRIRFDNLDFDLQRLQCFIQGGECRLTVLDCESISIEIKAQNKLTNRRHLYTITIPQKSSSQWYWFSHQWIFPERP